MFIDMFMQKLQLSFLHVTEYSQKHAQKILLTAKSDHRTTPPPKKFNPSLRQGQHPLHHLFASRYQFTVFSEEVYLKIFEVYVVTAQRCNCQYLPREKKRRRIHCSTHEIFTSWSSYNIFFKILRYTSSENTVVVPQSEKKPPNAPDHLVLPKQYVVTAPFGDIHWFYQEFHPTFVTSIYLVN